MYSGVYGILLIIASLLLCGIFLLMHLLYRDFNIAFSNNMILLQPGINNISLHRYCLPGHNSHPEGSISLYAFSVFFDSVLYAVLIVKLFCKFECFVSYRREIRDDTVLTDIHRRAYICHDTCHKCIMSFAPRIQC